MKATSNIRPTPRRARAWVACIGIIIALGSGCATRTEIQSIVAESNSALFEAQLPETELGGDPASARTPPDPAAISRRIDDFIAAHPDQKVTNSALRVRQAILLIACKKFELAAAAFADATDLKTERDKALKANSETIIWWWKHAGDDFWSDPLRAAASDHLAKLGTEIGRVQQSPEIRDYLEELRARIGFDLANRLQASEGRRGVFIAAMNHYGASLTGDDIAVIKSKNLTPQSTAFLPEERRRLRADGVIRKARELAQSMRDDGETVSVSDLGPAAQGLGEIVLQP